MAVVEMKKIRLLIHRSATAEVLRALQKASSIEFTEVALDNEALEQREKSAFEFNYVSSRLDFVVDFLGKYSRVKGLRAMIEGDRVFATGSEIYQVANSFYYNDIIDEVQSLEEKLNEASARLKSLSEEHSVLEEWHTLDMSLRQSFETEKTCTLALKASPDSHSAFTAAVSQKELVFNVKVVTPEHALYTFFGSDLRAVDTLIRECDLEVISLPQRRGTPVEETDRIQRAIVKENEKVASLQTRAVELTKHLPKLKMVADYMYWQKQKHDLISRSVMTQNTLVFEGWCPKTQIDFIRNRIENKTDLFALEEVEAAEGEVPPVEIENNGIVKPFESITRLYGLPGNTDLDPTPYLAGFFFVFFGVALSDAGYGLVLATLTGFLLWKYRIRGGALTLMRVLFLGGISTFIVGLLFGGYFGIDPSTLPAPLKAIQAFDPIQNPLPVFYLSLGLGVIHVLTGLTLKILREARQNNLIGGLLDQVPWISMFLSLILFVGHMLALLPGPADLYTLLVFTSLFAIVITQGRDAKNPLMKLLKGILSLYNSIQYFSDILSYSRLLALGLATSALALAVNIIGGILNDAVPIVGPILMVAILIGGHIFNLAINVLGAFIHSARLQFIEFFGKFITGSGKDFKPFKREERYVIIE